MTNSGRDDATAHGGDSTAAVTEPDSPEQLRQEIEQTRAELGGTVEALAAKADVKAQVKDKVATTKEAIKEKVTTQAAVVKEKTSSGAEQVKDKVAGAIPEPAKEKVATGTAQLKEKAAAEAGPLWDKVSTRLPDPAREAVIGVPERVRSRPLPAVLGAVGLLAVWRLIRRRRRPRNP